MQFFSILYLVKLHKYHYPFIIKELAEKFERQFTCFGEITGKCITFSVPTAKEVTRTDKKGKKSQKLYLTDYNLLIMQDLCIAHYQILLILLKELMKLNIDTDTMIRM